MMAILIAAVVILLQWQYSTSNKKYYYPNDIINRSFDSKLSSVCPGDSVTFTCSTNSFVAITWSLSQYGTHIGLLNKSLQLGIFTLMPTQFRNLSRAIAKDVTKNQTGTAIYCSTNGRELLIRQQ